MLKKHLKFIILTLILLIPFVYIWNVLKNFIDVLTIGMNNRDGSRLRMFINSAPIIAVVFFIDFYKKKFKE